MRSALLYGTALVMIVGIGVARARAGGTPMADSPMPAAPAATTASSSATAVGSSGLDSGTASGWLGVLLAKQAVDVSPRAASRITSISVRPGDVVKQGQPLAVLYARDKSASLRAAAIAQRAQSERAARTERLRAAALASDDDAAMSRHEAERRAAEVDLARVLVEDAVVRAPFDGTIVARFVDPGAHVAAGTPILRMVDPNGARVRFGVAPRVADEMALGARVRFCRSDEGHGAHATRAHVTSVAAEVDRSTGLVVVEADVEEIGAFRSGTDVRVFAGDATGALATACALAEMRP